MQNLAKRFFLILILLTLAFPDSAILWAQSSSEEDTPVVADEMERPPQTGSDKGWVAPVYSGQEQALGYDQNAFKTPAGMEERVAFWKDIYIKYSTDQGILHDSRYLQLIYETVDFTDLNQNESLTPRAKEKARRDRVKQAKKQIEERLKHLQTLTSGEGLEGEDLRYWNLFANVTENKKFLEASRKGRLRFQLGQRDRFIEGIYQSGRHIREMEEIFRREGLPIELTRLPFVESSFNLKARSKVGASGIWQFMRSTARSYMRMDSSVDERNDPLRSTVAAARKLKNNFQMLGSWPLAVTGYNHGPSGVQRLVKKYKTDNLAELTDVRRGRFGFASANFYASFLAALQVETEADKHFGPLKRMAELRGAEVRLIRPVKVSLLLSWFKDDLAQAQMFNPHIRNHQWPKGVIQAKNFIRVPSAMQAQVEKDMAELPKLLAKDESGSSEEYQIQEGETIGEIASRFNVSTQALMDLNGIDDARRVRAGQKLIIPGDGHTKTPKNSQSANN